MNSLRDIKRRLRSAENIKKITDAMERVAAARLRRAQESALSSRPYAVKLKKMVEKLTISSEDGHPLFEQRGFGKKGLIVISADKGLSGSYNSNILAQADAFLAEKASDGAGGAAVDLFLFGKKAIEYYQTKNYSIISTHIGWGGKITLAEIEAFCYPLVERFLAKEYSEIWLLYTHYISIAKRNLVLSKFLPIQKPERGAEEEKINYIFEPKAEKIFSELLPHYCAVRIQEALFEAYASELAARIMAMQVASKNSKEMMERLTALRNRVRQEGITREMIEISSGQSVYAD